MLKRKHLSGLLFVLACCALASTTTAFATPAPSVPYTWTTVPFGAGGFVDGFLYHPKVSGILYARTDIGGMYRFDFQHRRWIPLLDHLNRQDGDLMGVLSIAIDPNDENKVYAACGEYLNEWARDGAVLRSNDRGATWQKTDLKVKLGGNADGRGTGDRLQVDPRAGNILFLGTNQDGLWKSTDGGVTFTKSASPGANITFVLFDPSPLTKDPTTSTLFAGVADGKGGLFISQDGGLSFQPVEGTPAETPQHAVVAGDGSLYVTFAAGDGKWAVNPGNASTGGVWKRDAHTGKWRNISPEQPGGSGQSFGYSGVDVDRSDPGHLFVSTIDRWATGDDIYESKDGGEHWAPLGPQSHHDATPYPWLTSYMNGQDKMGHWISDLKLNPFNADELVYGTGYGLWMSENLSATGSGKFVNFDFEVANLEETATTQMVSPMGGATLFVTFGDVGGGAWDDLTKTPKVGLFLPIAETDTSVDYGGLNPDFVARLTSNDPTHGFYSQDGGASWNAFGSSPFVAKDGKGNWHGTGTIAVSAKATSMTWVPDKEDAYYTGDNGKTWRLSKGWPADRDNSLIPVADKALDGVFYVFDRVTKSILISTDGGQNFAPIIKGIPDVAGWQSAELAVVPGRIRDLWLAAPFGLLHSASADKPMVNIKGVDEAWLVSFGAAAPGQSYPAIFLWGRVKGIEGLWRSDDEGVTWFRINDDAHQFGSFRAIAGDPLEYGTIYVAPHGRGILVGKKP